MNQFAKETIPISLEDEMRNSYLKYAMSVIVGRALPDVRDGLKPVHRRVLYAMHEMNNTWAHPFVKCARVVGEVMGKYHPHGDASIYDTLVRMAQNFSLRYVLVNGQGNFGSVDGDSAAAMRYTECRLEEISYELLADIKKETVDFNANYDGQTQEPSVLPTRIPNLLINGSSGIAVGMATNIPPHNITEVINGALYILKNEHCTLNELIKLIPAPDFPTGGIIYGVSGVHEGYRTGRGRVIIRAKTHFEEIQDAHRTAIIVSELPYQVNKKVLLERIANLVRDKKIDGILDLRDESDKSGMRIVIELKRNETPEVVLNNLYQQTQLQDSFCINMVALVNRQPKLLNLKQILECFLSHRREVVTRRTIFELRQARERSHILEGLAVALANINNFISIIRAAETPADVKTQLMVNAWDSSVVREMLTNVNYIENTNNIHAFRPENLPAYYGLQTNGLYKLSNSQVQEILQMRLQRLTCLEHNRVISEYKNVMNVITDLLDILSKPLRVTSIIINELNTAQNNFGLRANDVRRSQIQFNVTDLDTEDLVVAQDLVVTLSHVGYIKSQPISEYRSQKRGGRGKQAMITKDNDWIDQLFIANTHDYILCFSNHGRLYWLQVWDVPSGSCSSRGKPIVNMFPLQDGEKITVVLPLSKEDRTFSKNRYIFMSTSLGRVKKTPLSDFSHSRKTGIIAVNLNVGDFLIGAALTDGQYDIMLFSDAGKAVRFDENDVRSMGRTARGVHGMHLEKHQQVIALLVAKNTHQSVLTATENGFGKRTAIQEYKRHGRGTKGMIAIQTSKRNGKVVAATLVNHNDEIMLITTSGILIRTRVSEIREMSRATQGVTLIAVEDGTKLSGLQRVFDSDLDSV